MAEGRRVMRRVLVSALVAMVVFPSIDLPAAIHTYRPDPAASRVTIHVGKTGAFSFIAGLTHEVMGRVENGSVDVDLDTPSRSHVRLVIAAPELKVSPVGEPEGDAPK